MFRSLLTNLLFYLQLPLNSSIVEIFFLIPVTTHELKIFHMCQCRTIFVKTIILNQLLDLLRGFRLAEVLLNPLLSLLALSLMKERSRFVEN